MSAPGAAVILKNGADLRPTAALFKKAANQSLC
jgi:hypothetical protein